MSPNEHFPVFSRKHSRLTIILLLIIAIIIPLSIYLNNHRYISTNKAAENDTVQWGINPSYYAKQPQPVDTGNYLVGAWYYPGWAANVQNCAWDFVTWSDPNETHPKCGADDRNPFRSENFYPNINPYLNLYPGNPRYPEEQPWVADYQIKWAVEHGIKFFFFDFYWNSAFQNAGGIYHHGLVSFYRGDGLNAFLASPYNSQMNFAIMLTNDTPEFQNTMIANPEAMVAYWSKWYFIQPNYLRIDGKPLVGIFSYQSLKDKLGGTDKVADYLEFAQKQAQKLGYPGIYFMVNDFQSYEILKKAHFDGTARYDFYQAGTPLVPDDQLPNSPYQKADGTFYKARTSSYEDFVTGKRGFDPPTNPSIDGLWQDDFNSEVHAPYIPTVDVTADNRPGVSRDLYYWHPGYSSEAFRYQLQRAKEFVDYYPQATFNTNTGTKKMVLINAWNEWGEGGWLHPTKGNGFGYLEMVRQVFGTNPSADHTNEWIEDGKTKAEQVTMTIPTPLVNETNVTGFHNYGDSDSSWTDYTIHATITPSQFTSDNHLGFLIWKNGGKFIYVYLRQTGIFGRVHDGNWVGPEHEFIRFNTSLNSGTQQTIDIDAWQGRINVQFNGQITKTLVVDHLDPQFATTIPKSGGISTFNYQMDGATYNTLQVKSLAGKQYQTTPITTNTGQSVLASVIDPTRTFEPPPLQPLNLTPNNVSVEAGYIELRWDKVANFNHYAVRIRDNNQDNANCGDEGYVCINDVTGAGTTFVGKAGHTYTWWVHTIDSQGRYSPLTSTATFTVIPAPPTILKASGQYHRETTGNGPHWTFDVSGRNFSTNMRLYINANGNRWKDGYPYQMELPGTFIFHFDIPALGPEGCDPLGTCRIEIGLIDRVTNLWSVPETFPLTCTLGFCTAASP